MNAALAPVVLRTLARRPVRSLARVVVLAAAAALVGSMVLFVAHAERTMTGLAVRSVALDWQGPVPGPQAARRVAREVASRPGVARTAPAATGLFSGMSHTAAGATVQAGGGALLAVPPDYLTGFRTFRMLRGSLGGPGVVLDQQLASTLQAQPGDRVTLTLPQLGRRTLRVAGVASVTTGDVLFQPLDPLLGPAPAQPPANVAILTVDAFRKLGLDRLPSARWQVQAQVAPGVLTGSPRHALAAATHLRNAVERTFPGQVQFVDNLAASLSGAAGDALYAEALFVMLALPGALVALGLAYLAALGTVETDRRELRLLHARGATARALLGMAVLEALVLGTIAGAVGTGVSLGAVSWVAGGGVGGGRLAAAAGICVAVAIAGTLAARLASAWPGLRRAEHAPARSGPALWERLWLDVVALVVSGLVYWLTARTGFSAVVNPDSNPTLSLSAYMFLAPALLWLGATLLLLRLRGAAVGLLVRLAAGRRASWRRLLLASAGRRRAALNRGLLLAGLLLAFGVELALFSATYDQQARIDAQLTLGADVVATAPAGNVDRFHVLDTARSLPGVRAATPVLHAYAYVGPDLQDIFGVDHAGIGRATSLRDSYFRGAGAAASIARLGARRDGVLVSAETMNDYALHVGDLLRLRLLDRHSGRFRIVPFHVAGVVLEFPSAPRDSFMVANLGYLRTVTGEPGPNTVFVRAPGREAGVARALAAATRTAGTTVRDIRAQTVQTVSSITTVDLRGISRIEEAFAVGLAALALALLAGIGMVERRGELATMSALGAPLRRIASFVWTEVGIVLAAAAGLAALLGWLLAEMLVAMLRHVFDPPPDVLAVPWGYLALLAGAAAGGALVVALGALVALRRLPVAAILREE